MAESQKFWLLMEGPADAVMAEPCDDNDTSRALAVYRGDQPVNATIAFRRAYGRKLYDQVPTTALWFTLYSETFFAVLTAHQLTGWSSYPVSLSTPKVEYAEGYRGLVVTGRCGPVLSEFSRIATKLPPNPRGRSRAAKFGYFFDEATHDKSDVFLPVADGPLFVSQRAKEALSAAQLTGLQFEAAWSAENVLIR